MNDVALTLRQVRYVNKAFWRNPASAFFIFTFPLMFLVIFNGLFGDTVNILEVEMSASQFYVPAIAAFSVITACYTNLAITVTFSRDLGILKRIRGTPLPSWSYVGARILHASMIAVLLVTIVVLAGTFFYDVDPPESTLPAFVLIVVVGAVAFSALGLALTSVIPNTAG
jgi:ABC-2 type transport system permease protein